MGPGAARVKVCERLLFLSSLLYSKNPSSRFLLLFLRLLWICGQRPCVVQAKRHIHSFIASFADCHAFAPNRHRSLVVHRLVSPAVVIQRGLRTPTGRCAEIFFIGSILGLGARFSFTRRQTGPTASSVAAWTARILGGRSRFRSGCSTAPHARPTCVFPLTRPSAWNRSAPCRRCSIRC